MGLGSGWGDRFGLDPVSDPGETRTGSRGYKKGVNSKFPSFSFFHSLSSLSHSKCSLLSQVFLCPLNFPAKRTQNLADSRVSGAVAGRPRCPRRRAGVRLYSFFDFFSLFLFISSPSLRF